jgi:hypothetical protein
MRPAWFTVYDESPFNGVTILCPWCGRDSISFDVPIVTMREPDHLEPDEDLFVDHIELPFACAECLGESSLRISSDFTGAMQLVTRSEAAERQRAAVNAELERREAGRQEVPT